MAKSSVSYVCQECGGAHRKWSGRCDHCGAWNTLVEETPGGQLERTNEVAGEYAATCEDVARETNTKCLNLWEIMQQARPDGSWTDFLSDGLHLSAAGNQFVGNALVLKIEQEFPKVTPMRSLATKSVTPWLLLSSLLVRLCLFTAAAALRILCVCVQI